MNMKAREGKESIKESGNTAELKGHQGKISKGRFSLT